jgi:transcriptional regulator with XRE-family HTH domain
VAKNYYRESVSSHVAELLRRERERQNVSMTRLAEMSGLSQGMISLIEHEQRNPSLDTLLRICHALKIELSAILNQAEHLARKLRKK